MMALAGLESISIDIVHISMNGSLGWSGRRRRFLLGVRLLLLLQPGRVVLLDLGGPPQQLRPHSGLLGTVSRKNCP
jgi:hypothetical protein